MTKKEKIEKEKIEKKAVDSKPEEKTEDKPEIPKPEVKTEDNPEIVVAPRCIMEVVPNEETGGVDIVYSKHCSGGTVREIAGKIALDGVRFRPEPEPEEKPEEKLTDKSKEEIKKEFDKKVADLKKNRAVETL